MTILTKYGNMDVMLRGGAFIPDRTDDPGEIYYIRAPKPIWIDPYDSYSIDTGICINLPDGCEGVLRSRTRPATDNLITDETRIDGTGNRSILITIHGGNAAYYLRKGDIIAKLEIRPFARALKCDRCGKFYEGREGMLVDTELKRKYWRDRKTYDLCPECTKELEDFLKEAQNNERL